MSTRWWRAAAGLGAAGLLLTGLGLPSGASAVRARHKTPLEAGLDYYRGKTITFIAGGAPGGSVDGVARLFAPYLAAYLHATVNVEDVAASFASQDITAASAANGLTIGLLNAGPDAVAAVTGTPGLNFNPERVVLIGASGPNTDMYIVKHTTGYSSFAALIGNKTPIRELSLTSGYDTAVQLLVNAAFGIKAQVITGYANEAGMVQGFSRGDGDLMMGPLLSTGPFVTGGVAQGLAITRALNPGSSLTALVAHVPTLAHLAKAYPPKTRLERSAMSAMLAFLPLGAQIVFMPTRTPADYSTAMVAALSWSLRNPAEIKQALGLNLGVGWYPGPVMKQYYTTMVNDSKPLVSVFLGTSAFH